MAALGIGVLFVLFAVLAPLALYWFVREEDPDPSRTTSWREARDRASEDVYGDRNAATGDRESGFRSDRDDRGRRTRGERDDDGNHWE